MMIDHLRQVVDQLAEQPEDIQERYAREIEMSLRERSRIAAQLADPRETNLDALLEEADREIAAGHVYGLHTIL